MNKIILYLISGFSFIVLTAGIVYTSGSPGGYSGSPGDGGANCTDCHGGTASVKSGWITSNIPQSGYIAGQTYTITVTGTLANATKAGFEITCEDSQNIKSGTFVITNSTETKLTNGNKAVTQKSGGVTPTSGTKVWTVNWTAPSSGSGSVTFYAAFNLKTTARNTFTSTLSVTENTTSIETNEIDDFIKLYPNPTNGILYFNNNTSLKNISVIDLSGKEVMNISNISENIDISNLKAGIYSVVVNTENDKVFIHRVIKY